MITSLQSHNRHISANPCGNQYSSNAHHSKEISLGLKSDQNWLSQLTGQCEQKNYFVNNAFLSQFQFSRFVFVKQGVEGCTVVWPGFLCATTRGPQQAVKLRCVEPAFTEDGCMRACLCFQATHLDIFREKVSHVAGNFSSQSSSGCCMKLA